MSRLTEDREVQFYAIRRGKDRYFGPFDSVEEALREREGLPIWAIYDAEAGIGAEVHSGVQS